MGFTFRDVVSVGLRFQGPNCKRNLTLQTQCVHHSRRVCSLGNITTVLNAPSLLFGQQLAVLDAHSLYLGKTLQLGCHTVEDELRFNVFACKLPNFEFH